MTPATSNSIRSRTPLTFTNTIQIARPIEDVFAFLEDFTHVPLWNYWVHDVRKVTDGLVRVGTVFHQTRRDDQQRYRVLAHERPRRITVATLDTDRPAFTRTLELHPARTGTQIIDDWELDTGHPPAIQRLASRRIREGIATNLGKLKELLETGHTVLPDQRTIRLKHD